MKSGKTTMLLLGTLLLGAAGCGGDLPHPTLAIEVSPTTVKAGDSLTLKVTVTDFEFLLPSLHPAGLSVAHAIQNPSDNQGHYHVYLDSLDGNWILESHLTETPVEIPANTREGEHTLIVVLVHLDHTIVTPEVKASETITIVL